MSSRGDDVKKANAAHHSKNEGNVVDTISTLGGVVDRVNAIGQVVDKTSEISEVVHSQCDWRSS